MNQTIQNNAQSGDEIRRNTGSTSVTILPGTKITAYGYDEAGAFRILKDQIASAIQHGYGLVRDGYRFGYVHRDFDNSYADPFGSGE